MITIKNPNFDDVFELVKRLSLTDQKKLKNSLDKLTKKTEKESLSELLLKAPTWSDKDLKDFQARRNHSNKSRLL